MHVHVCVCVHARCTRTRKCTILVFSSYGCMSSPCCLLCVWRQTSLFRLCSVCTTYLPGTVEHVLESVPLHSIDVMYVQNVQDMFRTCPERTHRVSTLSSMDHDIRSNLEPNPERTPYLWAAGILKLYNILKFDLVHVHAFWKYLCLDYVWIQDTIISDSDRRSRRNVRPSAHLVVTNVTRVVYTIPFTVTIYYIREYISNFNLCVCKVLSLVTNSCVCLGCWELR
jgi:hypothetical protein